MNHADYLVDILDQHGGIAGQKLRQLVDKQVDIFHSVHVVLLTPNGEAVLSLIPYRDDLPNLYSSLLGTTMATIRHHGETAEAAARRGLSRELLIDDADLMLAHDAMVTLEDGRRMQLTAYLLRAQRPQLYRNLNVGELLLIDPVGVDVALAMHGDRFAPTLKAIWPSLQARVPQP